MKQTVLFTLLWLCYIVSGFSQKVTVLDKTTSQPLPYILVKSNSSNLTLQTNNKGVVDISPLKQSDSISFSFVGYQTMVLSHSQIESAKFKIRLSDKTYSIGELVVSASRFEEKREDVPQQIQIIKSKELQFMNQQTMADVVQQSGNVLVQKSQQAGGSPIIRGFETNKVLMVVDGVRMNNAIYRGGHIQNVITLDNTIMDRVEIVFGAGSVVYGSDALGGVIHFYTKNPMLADSGRKTFIKANAFTRYSTSCEEQSAHVDFNIGLNKVAFLTSITHSNYGDLRQGNNRNPFYGDWGKRTFYVERINGIDSTIKTTNPDVQRQSAYQQYDVLQKVLIKQSNKVDHVLNFQYSNSGDVPRYDRLTEVSGAKPKFAEWYYGPQKRVFGSYALNLKKQSGIYDNARVIVAYQNIEESRHDRRYRKDALNNRIEKLDVITLNTDLAKRVKRNEIRYGLEATYNKVNSTAFQTDITTGVKSPLDTRYPDGGSNMQSAALYVTHTFEISPKVILTEGLRYSYVSLNSKFNDTTFFPFPFSEVNQINKALNGNIGMVFMPGKEWRFSIIGSTGFRAPNVDDLSKVFESVAGSVVVPNPNIKPEYTYNGELSITKGFNKRVRTEAVAYYTIYKNAITTKEAFFKGQDSILFNGTLSQVKSNVNAVEAYIYGGSINLVADVSDNFAITSSLNYTYGRIKTDTIDYPLDHTPPVFGKTSLLLNLNKFKSEFFVMYNGWKAYKDYNIVGEDNIAYATPSGMPSWCTLNARGAYQFTENVQVQMALENILDQNYRVFGSNIGASGRNLIVTLRGKF